MTWVLIFVLMAIVIAVAVNTEVVSIIALTFITFIGFGVMCKIVLDEIDRREEERRNAEW